MCKLSKPFPSQAALLTVFITAMESRPREPVPSRWEQEQPYNLETLLQVIQKELSTRGQTETAVLPEPRGCSQPPWV